MIYSRISKDFKMIFFHRSTPHFYSYVNSIHPLTIMQAKTA